MGEVLEVGVFPEVGEVSQTEVVPEMEVVLRWGRFLRPKRPKKRNSKSTRRVTMPHAAVQKNLIFLP